ncbi:family 43 glycosylhydrolase [Rufibacter glacialis]|uniref:Family 43 glycosylhydrolase n=1 Tax=Rufibacter glacialis TaxID=1259555 RepID=A0A5M8QIK8_9BACT|nr:family 43 glycosylhydrolase [Rufibacter glacialis]KAA6434790.1 family 43 glycosylhydrolase [Rufibacter glacialis]GGK72447.1 hypothetical protein GCM10011405_20860 [Rufibacter glacialis]
MAILTSPHDAPFIFKINLRDNHEKDTSEFSIEVTGKDPKTDQVITSSYLLADKSHVAYLNFYDTLAKDFDLRVPLNRRREEKLFVKNNFNTLLNKNIAPTILYGYGDPAAIRVDGKEGQEKPWFYLLATSNDAPNSFPIIRSRDLTEWEFVSFVFPSGEKPEWAIDGENISDFWAPEMHKIQEEYVTCFVAREKETHELCIGIATSPEPTGPFVSGKEPLLKGNVIDPHIFVDDDKRVYFYWKEDNNDLWPSKLLDFLYRNPLFIKDLFLTKENQVTASFVLTLWPWTQTLKPMERFMVNQVLIEAVVSEFSAFYERLTGFMAQQPNSIQIEIKSLLEVLRTPIYSQQLTPAGYKLMGDKQKVIENDQEWEAHLVEGTWITKRNDKYYIFYSGNDFSTDQYGIGVGIAESPVGPFTKMDEPLLRSNSEWWAPGHPSIVVGPDGNSQMLLHAYYPGKAGYKQFRALLSVPIQFEPDGVLVV